MTGGKPLAIQFLIRYRLGPTRLGRERPSSMGSADGDDTYKGDSLMPIHSPERSYDALISYRRSDKFFASKLVNRLSDKYQISTFIDDDSHVPGVPWEPLWKAALEQKPVESLDATVGPTVIVIASKHLAEDRENDRVVGEVCEALEAQKDAPGAIHSIPIIVLDFDPTGTQALNDRVRPRHGDKLARLHRPAPLHHIPVSDPSKITEKQWDQICRPIVSGVRAHLRRHLQHEQDRSLKWATTLVNRCLSSGDHLKDLGRIADWSDPVEMAMTKTADRTPPVSEKLPPG